MNWLFTFFALPYIFWSTMVLLTCWSYYLAHDEDDFHFGAAFLVALIVAFFGWQYPIVFTMLSSWPEVLYVAGGYLVMGVVVAGYKWAMALSDFKTRAPEWLGEKPRDQVSAYNLSNALYRSGYKVTKADNNSFHLAYQKWPISNWITFWPLFTLSIVFDTLGAVLEGVAKKFSVS